MRASCSRPVTHASVRCAMHFVHLSTQRPLTTEAEAPLNTARRARGAASRWVARLPLTRLVPPASAAVVASVIPLDQHPCGTPRVVERAHPVGSVIPYDVYVCT